MNLIKIIKQLMEPVIVDAEVKEEAPVAEAVSAVVPEATEEVLVESEEVAPAEGQCEVCAGKGRVSDKESCEKCEGTGVAK